MPSQNRLKNRFSRRFSNGEVGEGLERAGGRTRARTWDPMIRVSRSKGDDLVHDPKSPKRFVTAPVSHQKQPEQTKTNTIEIERKPSKINESDR
jgi:hypothetical protein